jgi:hypothetical protein
MEYFLCYFFQIGLAGNLRDYVLMSHTGEAKKGSEICTFDGQPVGYTSSPIETVWLFVFELPKIISTCNSIICWQDLFGSDVLYMIEIFVQFIIALPPVIYSNTHCSVHFR